ncbi:NADH-quinone oxidoreductase subunit C [Kamptonema cortianum]|nr:NADH-quinone oxidoreductase subunit C [Geitlerinema splendidum]MDK3158546.1 NADH-quinone oxidoreductase subunit C [Kamptonema cortianum]
MSTPAANELAEVKSLQSALKSGFLGSKVFRDETFVFVKREKIADAIEHLKQHPDFGYDYFVECVGVDYLTWDHPRDLPERFEVVYNLYSTKTHQRIYLKVGADEGQTVPTVKHIFLGAEYPEREIQDLYGVIFEGNEPIPGERFLLPDDWVGYPLRKDFPLGGEDVVFHEGTLGPAVEDVQMPHAGESFEGLTGSEDVSGR